MGYSSMGLQDPWDEGGRVSILESCPQDLVLSGWLAFAAQSVVSVGYGFRYRTPSINGHPISAEKDSFLSIVGTWVEQKDGTLYTVQGTDTLLLPGGYSSKLLPSGNIWKRTEVICFQTVSRTSQDVKICPLLLHSYLGTLTFFSYPRFRAKLPCNGRARLRRTDNVGVINNWTP